MKSKVCPRCNKPKLISDFGKNRSLKDGLECYCKKCRNEYCQKPKYKAKKRKRERTPKYKKKSNENNIKRYHEKLKTNLKKQRDSLSVGYIYQLIRYPTGLKSSEITKEMVELKRDTMQLFREIKTLIAEVRKNGTTGNRT